MANGERPMTSVTLYMRPGCHLCADAKGVLARLGYRVDEVNIEEDAELLLRYDIRVPVVVVDGREILEGIIREPEARRALAALRRAR